MRLRLCAVSKVGKLAETGNRAHSGLRDEGVIAEWAQFLFVGHREVLEVDRHTWHMYLVTLNHTLKDCRVTCFLLYIK